MIRTRVRKPSLILNEDMIVAVATAISAIAN